MLGPSVSIHGLSKRFGDVEAVRAATLDARPGEIVALLGPSGCGKTTLLRLVAGFERPDAGSLTIDGTQVAGEGVWVPPERRRVGMVFQDYALFPHLTVFENVGFGLPRRARRPRVTELLDLVGLAHHSDRFPHELSGGQQQRVALARALAPEPGLVLLDEPWSNVDPQQRASLQEEVGEIIRRLGVTALLVTHDRAEAFALADRIAVIRDGQVIQEGTPEEIYFAPATGWVASFVGPVNVLQGRAENGSVSTVLGRFPAPAEGHGPLVDVLVRPELLELSADPSGVGRVVAREFRGHDIVYRVVVDGIELVSQRPSTESVALGDRVSIRVHDGRIAVLP